MAERRSAVGRQSRAGAQAERDEAHRDGGARDAAVTALFRRHCPDLVRLAVCLLGDRGAAEEVVQEAFVSLHRNWDGVRDKSQAGAYLRSAVVNGTRSRQRRLIRARAVAPVLEASTVSTTASAEDKAMRREDADQIVAGVQGLPQRQREVVVCRFYLDLSEKETAELLGLSPGSVKRHTHRAKATLQRRMEENR